MAPGEIYQSDPAARPDDEFEPGELRNLVVGNLGRLLDARRTPVAVTAVIPERAAFEVEICAFEDKGARWELALEEITRFQFARGGALAAPATVAQLEDARARSAHDLTITIDPAARAATLDRIATARVPIRQWLAARAPDQVHLANLIQRRDGDPEAFKLLEQFMAARGLADIDRRFSETFVSNPRSGELVKGHAIVLAELGLCPYAGRAVRDPDLFTMPWSKQRRAEHIITRGALMQELWGLWGHDAVTLYRGAAAEGPLPVRSDPSFVSATFSREIAEQLFAGSPKTVTAVLWRQVVPVARLFMSFVETRALNGRFKEAEAILVADPSNRAF